MACRLIGVETLTESIIVNWTPVNKFQGMLNRNIIIFIHENTYENVVCQSGGHFVEEEMS